MRASTKICLSDRMYDVEYFRFVYETKNNKKNTFVVNEY